MPNYIYLLLLLLITAFNSVQAQQAPLVNYLNSTPPDTVALLFAEGVVSTKDYEHSTPDFSPRYDEIYWSIRINGEYGKEIMQYVKRDGDAWSEVQVPDFSEEGKGDLYPHFSADGNEIYFTTDRLLPESADSVNRFIWKVNKIGDGWSDPEVVGFENFDIYGFSIAANGSIYFMAQKPHERGTMNYNLYYVKKENGKYGKPELLNSPISTEHYEDGPFISRDERFLIFESTRPGGYGKDDLYISKKLEDGGWGEPKNLGAQINTEESDRFPYISPDGKYFFFSTKRNGSFDIYWISASVIYNLPDSSEE